MYLIYLPPPILICSSFWSTSSQDGPRTRKPSQRITPPITQLTPTHGITQTYSLHPHHHHQTKTTAEDYLSLRTIRTEYPGNRETSDNRSLTAITDHLGPSSSSSSSKTSLIHAKEIQVLTLLF
ncbi:hypothetical protein Pst134EA_005570 [Puccinia striiformis f. sp. tritici]|uniref:hypothetical protein n=1 Tax=Puccinia striiformis f. sp. tritici TaxID=168172 RepID=UPI002008207B|nr:hypothetical protein Pst134EA_005570 [Puccinia striiformis f. sp. tritici]KAH9471691.1 hypothetical protein Pst134EA_005570 [Puccinia striiformis f. sp. tritici]